MWSEVKTLYCRCAFIIKPIDLKLHRMIQDVRLHDCSISDFFDYQSSNQGVKVKYQNCELLQRFCCPCSLHFRTMQVTCRSPMSIPDYQVIEHSPANSISVLARRSASRSRKNIARLLCNFVQAVVASIVWAFRRLKKPRCREMSARGYALHSVCPQLSFFSYIANQLGPIYRARDIFPDTS